MIDTSMLNFTVGPVMSSEGVRAVGGQQTPYFRTPEFSEVMLDSERLVLSFAGAPVGFRTVFMTGSGTASMEATIMNVLTPADKAIVVNGGSFGQRFVEMCCLHQIPFSEIRLDVGQPLQANHLADFVGEGYTAFVVNVHETSTGVHYDMDLISRFCQENHLLLIVDAISSFLADPFDMTRMSVDVMITGSQKALACPPGISLIVLSPKAQERVMNNHCCCMYLDLQLALKNGERGQTPFTPAVGILLQINQRLHEIAEQGGPEASVQQIAALAADFREKVRDLPFEFVSASPSNAVTSLHPLNVSAYDIYTVLKDEYRIWVCPNGGELRDRVFRVGHLGHLSKADNTTLVEAMKDMQKRGLIR